MVWRAGTHTRRRSCHRSRTRLDCAAAACEEAKEGGCVTLPGITFDTGALIALERRNPRMWNTFRRAQQRRRPVTVPTSVVAEWWRGRTDVPENLLRAVCVEDLTAPLAQLAGEAMAHVKGATVFD